MSRWKWLLTAGFLLACYPLLPCWLGESSEPRHSQAGSGSGGEDQSAAGEVAVGDLARESANAKGTVQVSTDQGMVVPSSERTSSARSALRRLRQMEELCNRPPSWIHELQDDKLVAIDMHLESSWVGIQRLLLARGAKLADLCDSRAASGQLELVSDGPVASRAQIEGVKLREMPSSPGQLVAHRMEGGRRWVLRVNPGDVAEIDDLSSEIRDLAALAIAGAEQILTQSK